VAPEDIEPLEQDIEVTLLSPAVNELLAAVVGDELRSRDSDPPYGQSTTKVLEKAYKQLGKDVRIAVEFEAKHSIELDNWRRVSKIADRGALGHLGIVLTTLFRIQHLASFFHLTEEEIGTDVFEILFWHSAWLYLSDLYPNLTADDLHLTSIDLRRNSIARWSVPKNDLGQLEIRRLSLQSTFVRLAVSSNAEDLRDTPS